MNNRSFALLLTAAVAGVHLATPETAEAGFTVHGSAGTAYILSGADGAGTHRTPTTLELAPGWNWRYLRIELPVVFGVADAGAYPEAPHVLMGVRPQVKLFPVQWLYAKLATQLYFGEEDTARTVYFGASVGGGFEIRFAGVFALNAELNVNPFFTPRTTVPIEIRGGATILF